MYVSDLIVTFFVSFYISLIINLYWKITMKDFNINIIYDKSDVTLEEVVKQIINDIIFEDNAGD